MSELFDLIIIGAAPAGITAAIYAARKVMKFLVITKDIGGQTAVSWDIENYTGYQFITGPELSAKFKEHMRKFDINLKENESVIDINKTKEGIIEVTTDKETYRSKTIIIASGKRSKELNVEGENEFRNKGLTYCATCDGPLFKDKTVAVIGGGNSALEAALQLLNIAKHVYLVNIASELTGDKIIQDKIIKSNKATVLNNAQVTAIIGDKFVKAIKIKKDNDIKDLAVEGVFVEIGLVPNSEFIKDIGKDPSGEIKVDSYNRTNIPGIFAAGDVTDVPEKQIIVAAGEGAKAALGVFKYLAKQI